MKDVEQMEIVAQRLGPFHREEKRNSIFPRSLLNLGKGPAEHETRRRFQLRFEQRHLIQRHAQRLLPQKSVLDIKRDAEQADVTRLKLRQEIRRDDIPARLAQKENERQIEV